MSHMGRVAVLIEKYALRTVEVTDTFETPATPEARMYDIEMVVEAGTGVTVNGLSGRILRETTTGTNAEGRFRR